MASASNTASVSEGEHKLGDGHLLYSKTWHSAEQPPKAILVFLHGFSDHCNAYYELFPHLASIGVEVRSFDQRGWGRSVRNPSQRGLTGGSSTVISDLCSFLSTLPIDNPTSPIFLMGHSMGGGLALYYHLLTLLPSSSNETKESPLLSKDFKPPTLTGIILESPYIALPPTNTPSPITVTVGRLAAKLLPKKQIPQKMDPRYMSRDPKVCKEWKDDHLCHDTATLEGAGGILERHGELEALAKGKHISTRFAPLYSNNFSTSDLAKASILVLHGDSDAVTCYTSSRSLFDNEFLHPSIFSSSSSAAAATNTKDLLPFLPNKEFRSLDGAYHKLHADGEGVAEAFRKDVGEWILEKVKEKSGTVAGEAAGAGEPKIAEEKPENRPGSGKGDAKL